MFFRGGQSNTHPQYAARQMMNPPLFCMHRERHGSSTVSFARSLPLTLALIPDPPSGALQAPDADANHGSQVRPAQLRQLVSKALGPLLPVEPTLRAQFSTPLYPSMR